MHIIDPNAYPLSADAVYHPEPATLNQALSFEWENLSICNIVIIQPSIYGTDNSCTLDALREIRAGESIYKGNGRSLEPRNKRNDARAVVVIEPSTIDADTLRLWNSLGVRGVRINCVTVGRRMDSKELAATLRAHARVLCDAGLNDWVVQLYIALEDLAGAADVIPALGVRVCLDHFACPRIVEAAGLGSESGTDTTPKRPSLVDPASFPGFSALTSLLATGTTYIKLSAPYRISSDKSLTDVGIFARELLRLAPDRLLFGSDWPHVQFNGYDARPFAEACAQWCEEIGGKELVEKVFRVNAEGLWGISS